MSITFKNQGDVTTGTVIGHDLIQGSGLLTEDKQHLEDLTLQLEQVLAVIGTQREAEPAAKKETATAFQTVVKQMVSISKDVGTKVLTAILVKRLGG